jgi:hypothetical protein
VKVLNKLSDCEEKLKNYVHDIQILKKIITEVLTLAEVNFTEVIICGSVQNRIAIILLDTSFILVSINNPIILLKEKEAFKNISIIELFNDNIALAHHNMEIIYKLTSPKIKLISLCHKDVFLLPRFSLGISYIAAALRSEFMGDVYLCDMQLEVNQEDIVFDIENFKYDIIGISATFGQHDIIESLLNQIRKIPDYHPIVVLGGSLVVLNYETLLRQYNNLFVSMGAGEYTMQDVVRYWRGIIDKKAINNVAYNADGNINITDTRENLVVNFSPETDLLSETLSCNGVMQIETSRGCYNECSFCPRKHKGKWTELEYDCLNEYLVGISKIFKQTPEIGKKIFIVDEEFLGYGSNQCTSKNNK